MIPNPFLPTPHAPKGLPANLASRLTKTIALFVAATTLSHAQTVQTLSPESNGAPAAAGNLTMQITYDVGVSVGTGSVTVTDLDTSLIVETFDITDPADATVSGNTVTFRTFTAVDGSQYNVEAPSGFVVATDGGNPAPGFGFNPGDGIWIFDVVAADTTGPAVVTLSPQNGPGASVSSTLSVTYDENVSLGAGPWTITVFDVTGDQLVETFTEANTTSVQPLGTRLSVTLANDLAFNNAYRVTFSAGVVMDSAGNLSSEIASGGWEFTTGDPFTKGQVVISQVYGGGGNSGATLKNDFVELHNRSNSPISVDGWSVQYASSAGAFSVANNLVTLSGTIAAGGYYLVQGAQGTGGTQDLPTPDASGLMSLAGSNGKVLLSNASALIGTADPLTEPTVSDLVAYGSASPFEGSAAAPALSNTTAAIRLVNGSQDTDDNRDDFTTGAPAPRNSASPPFIQGNDGSGIASVSNVSGDAGILLGTKLFRSSTAARTVQIDLAGSNATAVIETVEIDVPSDLATLSEPNISISGAAAGGGSISLSGRTITISGVAMTTADALVVSISGLTTPDAAAVPADSGDRTFTMRTATSGGTPTELVTSPTVTIAVAVADLAELRGFDPSDKTFLIPNEVLVTFFDTALSFRNQHYIQDSTAGILIDDSPSNLGASYDLGDGLTNLVGKISTFSGILQFNPLLATPSASSTGNTPQPVVVTLAELTANPETYESRLVRVNAVTFQDPSGNFANDVEGVLVQESDTFGFRPFTATDYTGTAIPSASLDLVGISRPLQDGINSGVSPRYLADFIGDNVFPDPGNGSGLAAASNSSPSAGSLSGSTVFPSSAASQTVRIDIQGSLADKTIETVEIDVPADFGTLSGANVSVSGSGAGTGTASLTGRTVTVSGVAVTATDFLVVSIAGLTTPDVSADPDDAGNRPFAVRTAISGGSPRTVAVVPQVRIAMPVADLATLRAVTLPSPKAYLIPNEVIVTYVESGNFRNQHYIQDATGGVLIDDRPVTLGTSYLRGDGLGNLVGSLSVFGGILQFNPIAATANVSSTGNTPAPIVLTLSELTANPLTYQSRLVRVNGVSFQDASGNFANNSQHILAQGADTFGFRTFFNAEHSGTPIPTGTLDLIGVVRNLADASAECLSPRSLADFITTPVIPPDYLDWATQFAGGGAADEDFDGDGVPNGVEYFFGVDAAGFTPTPGIENGSITFPRDSSLTDVSFVVQTSDDLVGWDDVLVGDLDLSDPDFITYDLPGAPAPFFVRIKVTVAPPAN